MNIADCLVGLFRRFRAKVLGREVEIVGHCRLCGGCCRDILLRNDNRWLRTEKQYRQLLAEAPEHDRFLPVSRQEDGLLVFSCSRLGPDNRCTCHDTRPALCKSYPSPSHFYRGGGLRDDCGYSFRVTTFGDVLAGRARFRPKPFADILKRELEQQQEEP